MPIKSKSLRATSDGPVEVPREVAFVEKPKKPTKVVEGELKMVAIGASRKRVLVVGSAPPKDQIISEASYPEGMVYVLSNGRKVFLEGGKSKAKESKADKG